mgnify:CR=1 FL=1
MALYLDRRATGHKKTARRRSGGPSYCEGGKDPMPSPVGDEGETAPGLWCNAAARGEGGAAAKKEFGI